MPQPTSRLINAAERLQHGGRPRRRLLFRTADICGELAMTLQPGGPGRGMLLASIGFRVQPYKRSEVLSAVDETVRRMRTTSGCARSRLLEDADDPNAFMLLSEWQSAATADIFFNSRDFQIFKGIRILLRDEPVIVFDEVQSRMVRLLRAP